MVVSSAENGVSLLLPWNVHVSGDRGIVKAFVRMSQRPGTMRNHKRRVAVQEGEIRENSVSTPSTHFLVCRLVRVQSLPILPFLPIRVRSPSLP